jgi:transposase-like protein
MKPFANLFEVLEYYKRDDNCRDTIEKMRWPDGNIICPKCKTDKAYRMGDMKHYKCRNKKCGSRFSGMVGSVFEATKLHLSKWFGAMYLITAHKKGISSHQLARDLGIRQKAAWFLAMRCREIIRTKSVEQLNGIVQIDETHCGGHIPLMNKTKRKKYQETGVSNKIPVMGLLQVNGSIKMQVIGRETFKDIVRASVNENSMIVTDNHKGYSGLANEFIGHVVVDHSKEQYVEAGFSTNAVEGAFSHFKRSIIGTWHHISPKHLHRYTDEFSHRWNSKKLKDADRFVISLKHLEGRLKWKDLTAGNKAYKKPTNYDGIEFINPE